MRTLNILLSALAITGAMALGMVPAPAEAARIDVRTLTCQQARALVRQNGAIVMTFTDRTYDRVVSSRIYCDPDEIAEPFFTQTLDVSKCNIGGICKESTFDLFDRKWRF